MAEETKNARLPAQERHLSYGEQDTLSVVYRYLFVTDEFRPSRPSVVRNRTRMSGEPRRRSSG